MDIFEEVKKRVEIVDVCRLLGIKLDRSYKSLCPFHKEKTSSFSVHPQKNIFFCFGCGKKGDSITLVQNILGISPLESAKFLNTKLNLGIDMVNRTVDREYVNRYMQQKKAEKKFREWENKTFQLLCDYYKKLRDWKKINNPENAYYIKAITEIDYISYLIDEIFIYGTDSDKIWFKKNNGRMVEEIWKTMSC